MQQSKQQAASRTTVMEDVLAPKPEEVMGQGIAAVPQEAPSALAALPSNLPTEEMAGGGIVAFAKGDLIEDDEDEEEELQRMEKSGLAQLMGRLSSGLTSFRGAIPDTSGISIPKSYEGALAEKGQTPATVRKMMMEGPKKGDYVMPPLEASETPKRGGHKYEDAVVKEAQRLGVDPQLALHVLYKETGNLKNPETARSKAGAIGVMQLMPRTAKELGVDPMNPEENIRGGVVYLKKMMDQFNDPTLALAAYNAGPGRVNQILRSGRGIEALPRETQNYIRMADGGIVAFANGGLGGEFGGEGGGMAPSGTPRQFEDTERDFVIDPMTGEKLFSGYTRPKPAPGAASKTSASVPTKKTFSDEDEGPYTGQTPAPEISKEQIEKLIGGTQGGGEKEDSMMKRYMALLEGREKSSADQRKQDAYLSLLSAGLGMMGGTSPFAAVNIGQGAQAGVAAQMAARKAQIADERATLSGFGTAAVAQEAIKERQERAAQGREGKIGTIIANREKQLETAAYNNAVKAGGLNFSMLEPAQQQAAIAREVQRLKSTDPLLSKLYKEYGLPPIEVAAPAPQQYNKEQILKEYGKK
jgi:soluble lytic murein transglycosylase-like protein